MINKSQDFFSIDSLTPGDFVLLRPTDRCISSLYSIPELADQNIVDYTGDGLFLVTNKYTPATSLVTVEYVSGNQYATGYGYRSIVKGDVYTVIVDIIKPEDSDKLDKVIHDIQKSSQYRIKYTG